jgi:hypothetical protein
MKLPHAPATATALIILATIARRPCEPDLRSELPRLPQVRALWWTSILVPIGRWHNAASASGRSAQCVVNPYYGGPNAGRSKRQKRPQSY